MKGSFKLQDVQQQKKQAEEEVWVKPKNCLVCNKLIAGAYGAWEHGWTCSGHCERIYSSQLKGD